VRKGFLNRIAVEIDEVFFRQLESHPPGFRQFRQPASDVRRRQHEQPAGPEKPPHGPQFADGVGHMLDHVPGGDNIVGARLEWK